MASPVVDVYVKLNTGRVTTLNLLPGEQVRRIYDHVAQEEEIPVSRIQIKYTGKILNKKHTVGYLGIRAETILKAEILPIKDLTVSVKLPSGDISSVTIQNISTIQEIKNRLEAKTGVLPSDQRLKANGCVLNNNSELAWEVGIKADTVLQFVEHKKELEISDDKVEADDPKLSQDDEEKRMELLNTFDAAGRRVEVVFSFDTTGSMFSCLAQVREKVKETVDRLLGDIADIRIGIIVHGDYCDYSEYVLKVMDLTSDANSLKSFVMDVPSTGGGDSPECYEWVLHKAQQLDWSENSAKALVVIGDDVPHPPSYTTEHVDWHEELNILRGMGVKVYGVRAQHELMAAPFYEELAERTGGAYIPFRQFSLIKDMFLAVCYNEAGQEQLQAFSEEVEKEGRMTEEAKEMFTKMENMVENIDDEHQEEKPTRYVKQSWWDSSLDTGSPLYTYSVNTDQWKPVNSNSVPEVVTPIPCSSTSRLKKKSKWFSCFCS